MEREQDQKTALLNGLIDENRNKYGLLFNGNRHNHVPHGLSAAFQLGCSIEQLKAICLEEEKDLMLWNGRKTNRVVGKDDVKSHLGDLSYEGDFVTFFENESLLNTQPWQSALQSWLLDKPQSLLPGLIGGYGHPLILLADAVELGSSKLAIDALALTAIDWNAMARIVSMPLANNPTNGPKSLIDILNMVRNDHTFDGLITGQGIQHVSTILSSTTASVRMMQYYRLGSFYLTENPDIQQVGVTSEMISLAVYLLVATHDPGQPAFDFYLAHNLTFVNSIRILRPTFADVEAGHVLLRIYWLLTILAFITQGRPVLMPELIQGVEVTGEATQKWEEIKRAALSKREDGSQRQNDPHFLKAVQILVQLDSEDKSIEPLLLSAATKLVKEFNNWAGFGL